MSNAYRITQEFTNSQFNYGGVEETIGFVCDNYYRAISMYRAIVKVQEEIEQTKQEAHEELQKLRDNEDRWKRRRQTPQGFDKEEHQKRKEYLVQLREAEFEILYNGIPISQDKLGNLILNNMKVFKELSNLDKNTRKILGSVARPVVKAIMWPTLKLLKIEKDRTSNPSYSDFLERVEDTMKEFPVKLEEYIVNP